MADDTDGELPWIETDDLDGDAANDDEEAIDAASAENADPDSTEELDLGEIDSAAIDDKATEPVSSSASSSSVDAGKSLDGLSEGDSVLDDFSHDDYLATTTVEYEGLAEAIRQSETESVQMQAVAAPLSGIDSGVVGFEDVTGEKETTQPVRREPSDLPLRVVSALALVGLLVGSVVLGGAWFVGFICLASFIAVGEFYAATRTAGYAPIALLGLLGAIFAPIAGYASGPGGVAGMVVLLIVAVLVYYALFIRKDPLDNAAVTIFGIVWVPGMLGFATALARSDNSAGLIIGLVLVAASVDTGSYFVGKSFGKHAMAPVLSPNKTWEGLAGGVAGAIAMAALVSVVSFFDPFTLPSSLYLVAAVVVASPLGDLAESMIKRSLGVKDMGSILPGHGGLLDRIDSLLFSVPIGYFVFQAIGYLNL